MKGDFSRRTFDAAKHYTAVLVEQGRLLTDADSEEEHRILFYRGERATHDMVGGCGGALPDAGFGLTKSDANELLIGAGRYYAAGELLENETETAYHAQPDRFDVEWPLSSGRHAIVLDSWRRLITALDDASIREVALGGPTTSSREKVVWQVRAIRVGQEWVCTDELPAVETTTGQLAARAEPDEEPSSPCLIPPQAGYTGLENQFYRVEIFDSGPAYDVDAAVGAVAVTGFPAGQPNQLVVAAIGTLAKGDGVEVFRTGPGSDPLDATFGYITDVDTPSSTLTLSTSLPVFGPTDAPALRPVRARVQESIVPGAAFVVSRDNGSVVTTIEAIDGVEISVHDTGPDDVLGFAVGQLVEITDDRIELEQLRRRLHQIADIDQARRVIVLRTPAEPLDTDPSGVRPDRHPKLRRWDAAGAVRLRPDGSGWIHLENGNQVRFVDGHYRSGDYWTFPARAATVDAASGTIEWPQDGGAPALRSPHGIDRHRCVLGYIDVNIPGEGGAAITNVEDCRNLFPPLTAMRTLLYVGGDGQEVSPADAVGGFIGLPGALDVRVANGGFPVEGATVHFSLVGPGAGRLEGADATKDVSTDGDGVASCRWDIDTTAEHQVCVAELLAPSGDPIPHQVVRFHATIDRDQTTGSRGCCFSVGPGGDFPTLAEALNELIGRDQRDICLCLTAGDHVFVAGEFAVHTEPRTHLSIHGCGRATRLLVRGPWRLNGWTAVRLADFDMLLASPQADPPPPDAFLSLVDVSEVNIREMQIFGRPPVGRPPGGGLVRVYGFARLQVASSVIVSRATGGLTGPARILGADPNFPPLGALGAPWGIDNEEQLRDALLNVALETANLPRDDRVGLASQLRRRIERPQVTREVSRGEINAFNRLHDVLLHTTGTATAILDALDLIVKAAVVARPGVALEIGTREIGTDEREPFARAEDRASVVITDNLIPGIISFYGVPGESVSPQVLRGLKSQVTPEQPNLPAQLRFHGIAGDVHIRDNRLGRLALGRAMTDWLNPRTTGTATSVYENFHVTDNVIGAAVSETVARHTALTSNDFTLDALPEGPQNPVIAHVIGDTATYTGNHAQLTPPIGAPPPLPPDIIDTTRTSADAANLELEIVPP